MARSSEWYYQVLGDSVGPVHAAKLRALAEKGTIATDTLVRRGNSNWVSASSVKGLFLDDGDEGDDFLDDERSPARVPLKFMLSTGDIPYPYEILDLVFAFGNTSQGNFERLDTETTYRLVSELLKENALNFGADGILNVRFEYRDAVGEIPIIDSGYRVFEVIAYGTAVRATDESKWPKP